MPLTTNVTVGQTGHAALHNEERTAINAVEGAYKPSGADVAVADGGTGASTAATARSNLGAAALSHTHTAADVSDATVTGKAVMTAASQANARTAIGAGTSSLTSTDVDARIGAAVGVTVTGFEPTQMKVTGSAPTADNHLARKDYVDDAVSGRAQANHTHLYADITDAPDVETVIVRAVAGTYPQANASPQTRHFYGVNAPGNGAGQGKNSDLWTKTLVDFPAP